jgi:hypothetical protein
MKLTVSLARPVGVGGGGCGETVGPAAPGLADVDCGQQAYQHGYHDRSRHYAEIWRLPAGERHPANCSDHNAGQDVGIA